ncbi:MAG: cupin domain-containing protein [Candidatus Hodarchaeota archaeon]
MLKKYYKDIENKPATLSDGTPVENVYVRWLIDEHDGAKNFAMRRFEIRPNGKVPIHYHPQDHEIYILHGTGVFYNELEKVQVQPGNAIYIPPNEKHGINNIGTDNLVFLCLVPYL